MKLTTESAGAIAELELYDDTKETHARVLLAAVPDLDTDVALTVDLPTLRTATFLTGSRPIGADLALRRARADAGPHGIRLAATP